MADRLLARLLAHLGDDLQAQVREVWSSSLGWVRRRWEARPRKRLLATRLLTVALIALGLGSLDARGRLADRLPSPRDWRALAALLERDARAGDLVAILPPWLERARQVVPARLPVLATDALDAEWLPEVRRVWLVEASGVTAAAPRPLLADRATSTDTQQVGRLRVTRIDLAAPVFPRDSLAERGALPTRWHDVQGVARRCLELAVGPRALAYLPLPKLMLGGALAGHAALLPSWAAGPARLLVRIDDGPPIPMEVTRHGGWQPFRIDTTAFADTAHAVTLGVEAPPGAELCVEALVLP